MQDESKTNPYAAPELHSHRDRFRGIVFPLVEDVQITPDVLADAHIARYGTGSAAIRVLAGVVALATSGVTILLAVEILAGNVGWSGAVQLLAFFGLMSLGLATWSLAGRRALRKLLCRAFGKYSQGVGPVSYQFTADALHVLGTEHRLRWDDVLKAKKYHGTVLLFYSRNDYVIVPTAQISTSAKDLIRELLS